MVDNPLFPPQQDKTSGNSLPQTGNANTPLGNISTNDTDLAANIIRQKLVTIYADEPSASAELKESKVIEKPHSKHQQFMLELSSSGKSMAEIQTAWHNYYTNLPDQEKHQVWQEFYEANAQSSKYHRYVAENKMTVPQPPESENKIVVAQHQPDIIKNPSKPRSVGTIKQHLLAQVNQRSKLQAKHHLQSLGFGLAMGLLVVVIFLFSFFNQVIIAPFIQPSRHVSATPIIVDSSAINVGSTPQVIIPKINVEIPVDYTLTTDDEAVVENALQDGVVHYPSTVVPGQNGNAAFFGHSSNNIFNPGKYKFAFVLLHTLVKGDTFYLTYQGQVYIYQVINRQIVSPSDVSVLNDTDGQVATATLITCDPPGTSINRLVVTGQQISPNPSTNTNPSSSTSTIAQPNGLASNGPSLWDRFWKWL